MKLRYLMALLAGMSLAGCRMVGPDYRRPQLPVTETFRHAPNGEQASPPPADPGGAWWLIFEDAGLDRLERAALATHPSLATAAARIAEARARLHQSEAGRKMTMATNASARLAGESSERTLPVPGRPVTYRENGDAWRWSFDASYEVDLWGRVKRSMESSGAQVEASEADARAAGLALSAEVAQTWLGWRALTAEAAILEGTRRLRAEALGLLESRCDAGYIPELEVRRAEVELATLESEMADLERRRALLVNALVILTSIPADQLPPAPSGPLPVPPVIPVGLPAALLGRRPDLAAAEASLQARCAEVGVAEAARYPSIRLTGSAGFESTELLHLLERPAHFWQLGPSLSLPLLDGGQIKAGVEAAQARVLAAESVFREKTLLALREVEDGLVDLRQQAEQAAALARAATAAGRASQLAQTRYESGLAIYLEVIEAERSALQIERTRAQLAGARQAGTVRLIRALGGGW